MGEEKAVARNCIRWETNLQGQVKKCHRARGKNDK